MLSLVDDAELSATGETGNTRFTPQPSPVAPGLGRAFAEACRDNAPKREIELRDATIALVERLKVDRLPPERVVIALKAAIAKYSGRHALPSLDQGSHDADGDRREATYRRVFEWCLDAYYDAG